MKTQKKLNLYIQAKSRQLLLRKVDLVFSLLSLPGNAVRAVNTWRSL